ncbi:MAG: GntR family transcriptional regulator [Bacteroidota bacterium]
MGKGINPLDPTPYYEQVELDIKNKIQKGILLPGQQIASQNDLAREYEVSLITIKKALFNLVNEGVLYTRIGKGTYVAEPSSRKIDLSAHKTIGLVLRDIKHPYFSSVVHYIEERANELGFNLLLSSSSNNMEKEEAQINRFRNLGVDGIIIASLSLQYRATDYIKKLHEENFPYVMVSYMHDPECWYIGSDHEYGGFLATEHLIKLGYKKIGFLHVGRGNLLSEIRKNGYYRALSEYNIPYDSRLINYPGDENFEFINDRFVQGYQFGKNFKNLEIKPDALFIHSDLMAVGFENAILEEGFNIPDDIAIVGFDGIEAAALASVPLTTIVQPAEKIGRLAVDVIQKRIDGIDVGNRTILKPTLIIRESCGAKKLFSENKLQAG